MPLWSSFEDGKTRAQLLLLKHHLSLHYTRDNRAICRQLSKNKWVYTLSSIMLITSLRYLTSGRSSVELHKDFLELKWSQRDMYKRAR